MGSLQVVLDPKLLAPISGGAGFILAFVLTELIVCLLSQRKRLLLVIDTRLKLRLTSYDIADDDRDITHAGLHNPRTCYSSACPTVEMEYYK